MSTNIANINVKRVNQFQDGSHRYFELSIKNVLDLPEVVTFNCSCIFFCLSKRKRSKRKGHHGQRHISPLNTHAIPAQKCLNRSGKIYSTTRSDIYDGLPAHKPSMCPH